LAVAVAAIVTALATGAYVVSQAQIMGFGTPTPFAEKPLSLMARQFAGGLLWGGAVAVALGVITLWWDTFATTPWWIWTLLGAGLGVMLALPIFGAASGFFAEMVAAAAGAAALLFARQQLRVVPNTLHPPR
jgi:hypothetical protein